MTGSEWQKVKSIFDSAVELPPEEQAAYLADACASDNELRREVEKLLGSYRSDFMEPSAGNSPKSRRLAPGDTIGRYTIVDLLGVGGMGEVYLAKDGQLDRKVAIKVLTEKYEGDEENVRRFIQEAKAASALNHPNILTIHEIGATQTANYIVSEFVDGHRLRTVLEKESIELSRILNIAVQVAEALSAAHAARIIHRDIKPENIVIRNDGYAKVLDFGLAKLLPERRSLIGLEDATLQQNETAKGLILGTVSYMSPEQAKGEAVDARTDIFSLGVLLYEMITGRTPFTASSSSETLANLINREPDAMSRYTVGLPDELQRIVSKMLRKNPDERYQTMKGLLADLREFKDRLSIESKLQRTSSSENDRATEVLAGATGQAARTTVATSPRRSWLRRLAIVAGPILLLGIFAAAWYWARPSSESQPTIKSLAVLPLKSLNSQEDVLGLGIADAVIRRLSQTGTLTVRPRSAVQRYLHEDTDALTAARQLTTDAILEGSIQRDADRLRVSVNLLRTSDGASLWADNFDMRMADIFTIQDTVAQQVASRLSLQLDPEQQARLGKRSTSNPIAYEYYAKGVNALDQRGFGPKAEPQIDVTIDLFKKAVEADPNFALARTQLAFSYTWKALFITPDEQDKLGALARDELNRAEAIDPHLAETYITRSWFKFSAYEGWQTEAAAREVLLAQQINPNAGHADLAASFYHMGLESLSEREYQKAMAVDPTSDYTKRQFVYFYMYVSRWEDYREASRKYFPDEDLSTFYYISAGQLDEAQKMIDKHAAQDPEDKYVYENRSLLAAYKGNFQEAEKQLSVFKSKLDRRVPSYHHDAYDVGCIYAVMGRTAESVSWLREAATTGFTGYPTFERDRFLDRVRQTPEFIQFMSEMKELYEKRLGEFQ